MSKVKSRIKWTEDAEEVLLKLWEEFIGDLRRQKRNSHVYAAISTKLHDMGFVMDPTEIHNKLSNMTQRYRSESKAIEQSGGGRSNWQHYDRVCKILGCFPVHDISLIEESISSESQMQEPQVEISEADGEDIHKWSN